MSEDECKNTVKCPYCDKDFHVCDVFPPLDPEQETEVMLGGQQDVRCDSCMKMFSIEEEIRLQYNVYAENKTSYEN